MKAMTFHTEGLCILKFCYQWGSRNRYLCEYRGTTVCDTCQDSRSLCLCMFTCSCVQMRPEDKGYTCADRGQTDNLRCYMSGAEHLIFEKGSLISLKLTY